MRILKYGLIAITAALSAAAYAAQPVLDLSASTVTANNITTTLAASAGKTIDVFASGTDDTSAINAAITLGASNGKAVTLYNTGTNYIVSSPIVPVANTNLVCIGRPTIFLKAGSNSAVIQSAHFVADTATPTYPSDDNVLISGCIIDGNRANQTTGTPDLQNGISIYGQGVRIEKNIIQNIVGHGMRLGGQLAINQVREPIVQDNKLYTIGRHGIWYQGTNDAHFIDNVVVDASQATACTYNGLQLDTTARIFNFHGWHTATATNRVAYQAYVNTGGAEIIASHLEGGCKQLYDGGGGGNRYISNEIYSNFGASGNELVTVAGNDSQFIANRLFNNGGSAPANGINFTASASGNMFTSNKFIGIADATRKEYVFTAEGNYNVINGDVSYQSPSATSSISGYASLDTIDFDRYVATGGTEQHIHVHPGPFSIGGSLAVAGAITGGANALACDGATNDTTAFAASLSANKTILLPPGKTCLVNGLVMTGGQTLDCQGSTLQPYSATGWIIKKTGFHAVIRNCVFNDPNNYTEQTSTLASGASPGASTITAASAAAMSNGEPISIALASGAYFVTKITGISSNTITLQDPIPYSATAIASIGAGGTGYNAADALTVQGRRWGAYNPVCGGFWRCYHGVKHYRGARSL